VTFSTSQTEDFYHTTHLDTSQTEMASLLKQLTSESSELLQDSQVDLERLQRVKDNFKTTTLMNGDPKFPVGGVTISGPNHLTSQQQQSVIVRNTQAVQPGRTYTNQQFSVDFSTPIIINVPPMETKMTNLPVTIMEVGEEKDTDIFKNFEIVSPKKEVEEYLCYCCGEKAGKHSYYGGQVCASCRAFFRRSVQSKYYEIFQCKFDKNCKITSQTRKTCQFCRFKKCLEAGMKPSWVLSDEERNRRFNKFNKLNMKSSKSVDKKSKPSSQSRLPELYMTFTLEEQKLIEDIQKNFRVCHKAWLRNLLIFDRKAGINMIESAYKLAPLNVKSWKNLEKSCHVYFVTNIVPNFTNLDALPQEDRAILMAGKNSNVSHLFKTSQCLKIKGTGASSIVHCKKEDMCPLQSQVAEIAANNEMIETYDLSRIMSRLNLGWTPQFPSYEEVFPSQWANNSQVEARHRQIMERIQNWPYDQDNEFDQKMLLLVCLMLLFNTDFENLKKKDTVENVQLKYSLLLQRYLRSKMSQELANKKFLEAMMLLSFTRELWEMNELYMV